ncbi:MAG: hypothetical protein KJ957_03705 [Candidatus Omnitrophica bacterium]|nr:hypothetical protein [Candidatus Omnitrophota bacterium]
MSVKIGSVDLGEEYRGGVWDLTTYVMPGLFLVLAAFITFGLHENDFLKQLFSVHAVYFTVIFLFVSFITGHLVEMVGRFCGDTLDKSAIIREVLSEKEPVEPEAQKLGYTKDIASLFREPIVKYLLNGESTIIEKSPNEVYYFCVQFLRHYAPDLYSMYASRQYWISEMRLRMGYVFFLIAALQILGIFIPSASASLYVAVSFILLGALFVYRSKSARKFLVMGILRAFYIVTNPQLKEFQEN